MANEAKINREELNELKRNVYFTQSIIGKVESYVEEVKNSNVFHPYTVETFSKEIFNKTPKYYFPKFVVDKINQIPVKDKEELISYLEVFILDIKEWVEKYKKVIEDSEFDFKCEEFAELMADMVKNQILNNKDKLREMFYEEF